MKSACGGPLARHPKIIRFSLSVIILAFPLVAQTVQARMTTSTSIQQKARAKLNRTGTDTSVIPGPSSKPDTTQANPAQRRLAQRRSHTNRRSRISPEALDVARRSGR